MGALFLLLLLESRRLLRQPMHDQVRLWSRRGGSEGLLRQPMHNQIGLWSRIGSIESTDHQVAALVVDQNESTYPRIALAMVDQDEPTSRHVAAAMVGRVLRPPLVVLSVAFRRSGGALAGTNSHGTDRDGTIGTGGGDGKLRSGALLAFLQACPPVRGSREA